MKKLLAILLAALMLLSLVACGESTETETNAPETNVPETNVPETNAPETDAPVAELAYKSAEELLNMIWNKMPDTLDNNGTEETEDDLVKSYFVGGMDADGMPTAEGKAGVCTIGDGSLLDNVYGYPVAEVAKIDDAASIMFMMNQNTFTCAAYHFTNASDVASMVNTIESNIQSRQWWCGFPEKVVVITLPGDYVIAMFGHETSFVNPFVENTTSLIEGAEVVLNNPIA